MYILFIIIAVIFLDQVSKIYIKYYYLSDISSKIIIKDFLVFELTHNPGVAFGLLSKQTFIKPFIDVLTVLILFFLFSLLVKAVKNHSFEKFPLAFIIGGAIGNMIDRLLMYFEFSDYKGVVDFIKLEYYGNSWYVFNIADACITIGVILFFIFEITKSFKVYGKENIK